MNEITTINTQLEDMSAEQLGGEIRLLTAQARKIVLSYAVEIGHRLVLAKEKVAHGEWLDWVARETSLSQSNVNRMMRLYEEYGKRQENLFGAELNSPPLTNLSVSNALALLAFPAEEREQAAIELDAEHLSKRDLEQAIKDKLAAEERAKNAEETAAQMREELYQAEEGQALALAELQGKLDEATEKAKEGETARKERGKMLEELDSAQRQLTEAKNKITELENRPVTTVKERDEQAIEDAARAAKAAAAAEYAKKEHELQEALQAEKNKATKLKDKADKAEAGVNDRLTAATAEMDKLRTELERLRREAKLSDANVTAVSIHFKAMQEDANALFAALGKIADNDIATAGKLAVGIEKLLGSYKATIGDIKTRAAAAPMPGQTEMGG